MDLKELKGLITLYISRIVKITKRNYLIVIIFLLILFVLFITIKYSEKNRVRSRINEISKNLTIKAVEHQREYCGEGKYSGKRLCEYHILSSYNCFLVGNQVLDYCSVEMIKKTLSLGVRYIEIPVFDYTEEPVCYLDYNGVRTSLNYIKLIDIVEMLGKVAFSDRFINNNEDPLFLFLNIKTSRVSTINKLADYLNKYLKRYFLESKYNDDILPTTTLCELKKKLVVLSNKSFKNTEMGPIINLSLEHPALKRLTYSESLFNFKQLNKPKLSLNTNKIKFISANKYESSNKNMFKDSIEVLDDEINLRNYGINPGDLVTISGSREPENNSGSEYFEVDRVTNKKIIFKKNVNLVRSDVGDQVFLTVEDRDKDKDLQSVEEYNKDNLTIVIPDRKLTSSNYDYINVVYKGCQFITMNFQYIDDNLINYIDMFERDSFKFKFGSLVHEKPIINHTPLSSMIPAINPDIKIDINYDLLRKLDNGSKKGFVIPALNDSLRLINDNRTAKFSLNFNIDNSKIILEKGINKNPGYVSIKLGERYLAYTDCGCYLYFTKGPKDSADETTKYNFNKSASFLSLKPVINKKDHTSLGIIKDDKLHYLKMRSKFSRHSKLFHKKVSNYTVKMFLNNEGTDFNVAVLKPKFSESSGFFPLGDLVVPLRDLEKLNTGIEGFQDLQGPTTVASDATTAALEGTTISQAPTTTSLGPAATFSVIKSQQGFTTNIFSGAVDKPIDYELIWDNKGSVNSYQGQEISIWKPICNEGFMEIGCVFNKGYSKPSVNEVVCVSSSYIREELIYSSENDGFGEPLFADLENQLAVWGITNHDYVKCYNFVKEEPNSNLQKIAIPNLIEFKMYDIILDDKDYYDRIYLDTNLTSRKEKEAALLKISFDEGVEETGNEIYDYLMKLENSNGKLISYTPHESGNKLCMALPQPYWSSFYDNVISTSSRTQPDKTKVKFEACKSRDYFGTNWNIYSDGSIRLEGNKDTCLTYNGSKNNYISTDTKDSNNYLYLDSCDIKEKNQQFSFLDDRIKVDTKTNYEPNACLTHTPEDSLRLEECGDKKYTVISKFNNQYQRNDVCSKVEGKKALKNISALEDCLDLSYYLVTVSRGFNHSHEEFCSLEDARTEFYKRKPDVERGIAIIHNGEILENYLKVKSDKVILENYIKKLANIVGDCQLCKKPSATLCLNNSIVNTENTYYESKKDKLDLDKYCRNLKNDPSFKCSRQFRQNFINNINRNDFCVKEFKEVYLYVYSPDQFEPQTRQSQTTQGFSIDVKRPTDSGSSQIQVPVDNLLGEEYDKDNYHIFIKGYATTSTDRNKFKIVFDVNDLLPNSVEVYKFSNDIILDYKPTDRDIKVGTKVLAPLGYQDSSELKDKNNINYDDCFKPGNVQFNQYNIKYMAVVIKKLNNSRVEVMFSINSYESNIKKKAASETKKIPFSTSNIRKIYTIDKLVVLRKPPLCL